MTKPIEKSVAHAITPITEEEVMTIIDMALVKSLNAARPDQTVTLKINKMSDGTGMVVETFLEPKPNNDKPSTTK